MLSLLLCHDSWSMLSGFTDADELLLNSVWPTASQDCLARVFLVKVSWLCGVLVLYCGEDESIYAYLEIFPTIVSGNDLRAINSIPTAIYVFLRSLRPINGIPFEVSMDLYVREKFWFIPIGQRSANSSSHQCFSLLLVLTDSKTFLNNYFEFFYALDLAGRKSWEVK